MQRKIVLDHVPILLEFEKLTGLPDLDDRICLRQDQ
jgi:hypothetical protein